MALWRVFDKTSAPLRGAVKHRLTTRLNSVKRQTQSRERRKRDAPFSGNGRVYSHSGACNGEFGGAAACNHILIAQNLSSRRKRGQLLLCNKHLFCSAGFLPILVILRATRPCFLYSQ